MRNDLKSLSAGKAMAQASHATNLFLEDYEEYCQTLSTKSKTSPDYIINGVNDWKHATSQGFGTVLVLEGNMTTIKETIANFKQNDYLAGIAHDPTYPILDGSVVHHIPLDTCGYVFVPDKHTDYGAALFLKGFNLHK